MDNSKLKIENGKWKVENGKLLFVKVRVNVLHW